MDSLLKGNISVLEFLPNQTKTMNTKLILTVKALCAIAALASLSSCAAGRIDRHEDRYDRREDRYDRRRYDGPGDVLEDRLDRRENVNDKFRGRRGF
jgi:hypothetical protein